MSSDREKEMAMDFSSFSAVELAVLHLATLTYCHLQARSTYLAEEARRLADGIDNELRTRGADKKEQQNVD